jgi:hypothetical protein
MRVIDSFCRFCSVDPEDVRELRIEELVITCSNCRKQLFIIPEKPESPFYYLAEVTIRGD